MLDLGLVQSIDPKKVKWLWWYSIPEDKLEGYDLFTVDKHASSKFDIIKESTHSCIRGKIIKYQNKYYNLLWTSGYNLYPKSVLEKIHEKVNKIFEIDYVVNESGQEIL